MQNQNRQNQRPSGEVQGNRPQSGQRSAGRPPAQNRPPQQNINQRTTRSSRPPQKRTNPKRSKNSKGPQQGGPRIKNRWFRAIFMVIVTVVGCIFLAFFILRSASDLFGLNQPDNEYIVNIPENADVKEVTDILSKTGVVETSLTFRFYMSNRHDEIIINPGEYTFNSNMGYDQIIAALRTAPVDQNIVTITVHEYLTLEEIAELLKEKEVISDTQEFLNYLDTETFDYDFLQNIPNDEKRYHTLEGYFFPDTYEFYVNERYSSIATKFLDNFDRKINDSILRQIERSSILEDLDDAIILASVIQKEAGEMKDMLRVSSVFFNRLTHPENFPRLQSDVTLMYAEDFIKPHMGNEINQEILDAYNTYVREGLPVGPICNPGEDAIYAALNAIDTDYYYFVTDIEKDFYFAETLQKHQENIETAAKVDESGDGIVYGIGTQEIEP